MTATVDEKPASPPFIELLGIGRRNPHTQNWLLHDLSFSIAHGERIGLLGPSGAGKTLLLRAIAWLDPVDAGVIRWNGRQLAGSLVPSYRASVIYLHQRPALGEGRVLENLRYPFTMKSHHSRTFDRARAVALLERLGRGASFLEKSIRDLSGGEAQITALVRAIQLDSDVLLFDEPTASLDSVTAQAVESLVQDWWAERPGHRAYVWVGHDLDQADRMTDRQVTLNDGRIIPSR
jgi:putative ABC transport system ATP-binding protein